MWKQEINQKKKREWKNLEEFVAELSCPWLTNWASVCFMLEKQFNKNDSDCYSAPDMEILCFQILWLRFRFTASRPSVNRQEIQPKHPGVSWKSSATILITVSVRFQLLKWENLLFFSWGVVEFWMVGWKKFSFWYWFYEICFNQTL